MKESPDDEMTLDEAQALLGISFDATNREQIHGFLDVLPEGDRAAAESSAYETAIELLMILLGVDETPPGATHREQTDALLKGLTTAQAEEMDTHVFGPALEQLMSRYESEIITAAENQESDNARTGHL